MTTTRQIDLTINKLTKAQYEGTTPNADEFYVVTDSSGITSADVINALGYTPYNASNPNGYVTALTLNNYAQKEALATVAFSGDFDDLTNQPTIGNGTVTITQGGATKGTFTLNQSGNVTINLDAGGSGGIQNTATGTDSLTILGTAATYGNSINIGSGSSVQNAYSTAIGNNSSAAKFASALGYSSVASANGSIQLGYGTNSTADTFNVGFYKSVNPVNYQLLDGTTGLIPDSRLSSNIARTSQISTYTAGSGIDITNNVISVDIIDGGDASTVYPAELNLIVGNEPRLNPLNMDIEIN